MIRKPSRWAQRSLNSRRTTRASRLCWRRGERIEGAALIGADGVHSRVRAALFGADAATFSGTASVAGAA
jgi:2-polyprenyl-6-methoxyphenol hydroxylase-like FAD-dependent oxidoreductase